MTDELPLARLGEIASKKAIEETEWQIFLRAVGCNWLVCLAVWMAMGAEDRVFAFLGNLVGAAIFVALSYWYLYGRPEQAEAQAQGAGRADNGDRAVSADRETARTGA